jgi:uncharacterized protein (DUF2345 family)
MGTISNEIPGLYIKGKNLVIEGTTNVTLKVGKSFIAIEASGIEIGTTGRISLDAKQPAMLRFQ